MMNEPAQWEREVKPEPGQPPLDNPRTGPPKTLLILDEVVLTPQEQTAFEKAWDDLCRFLGMQGRQAVPMYAATYLVECVPMPEPDHVVTHRPRSFTPFPTHL